MKISNNFSKYNFGAKPIYNVNLKKATEAGYVPVSARFLELSPSDDKDCTAVNNLTRDWRFYHLSTNHIHNIAAMFYSNSPAFKLYATETDATGGENLASKITAVIQTTNPKNENKDIFQIMYLQASPDIADMTSPYIKGSGELAMYGAVKLADENGFERVEALSMNNSFYEKIGFHRVDYFVTNNYSESATTYYVLSKQWFKAFLDAVAKKYDLKSDNIENVSVKKDN